MIITDVFYGIKHLIQKDKEKCPRCGKKPFMHGFKYYNDRYYCTHCGLWEPDWKERDKIFKKLMEGEK